MSNSICFCADENYMKHVFQVIKSIIENNSYDFSYYLVTDLDAIEDAASDFKEEKISSILNIITIDKSMYSGLKEVSHFTTGMYYRLSIPDLIPSERVLYLDCDIIVNGNLEELFKFNLKDKYVAAVDNPFFYRYDSLGMKEEWGYFNSGVMLINNKAWLKDNIKGRVIEYAKQNRNNILSPDQDALNAVLQGHWHRLPIKYNAQSVMYKKIFDLNKLVPNQVYQLLDPTIIHYSSRSKPWMKTDAHVLKRVYKKYSNISETSMNGMCWDYSLYIFNIFRDRMSFLIWKLIYRRWRKSS